MNSSGLLLHRVSKRFRKCIKASQTLVLCGVVMCANAGKAQAGDSAQATVTVDEYISRLQFLDQSVSACLKKMSPENCRSREIGPDLTVASPLGKRTVRLDWLRNLMDNAAKGESANSANMNKSAVQTKNAPAPVSGPGLAPSVSPRSQFQSPSIGAQLEDARRRLSADAELVRWFSSKAQSQRTSAASPERRTLTRILEAKEYHGIHEGPSLMQQVKEKIGNWINRLIGKLIRAGVHSRWIGLTAEVVFLVLLCVALVWLLIRIERQGRISPVSIGTGPGDRAVSARDWQLWLADAQQAASLGAWRDAIHLLYWASISRLESAGYWPADRARTPREYLVLLGAQSQYRASLGKLTRSFERVWYAGQPTGESDYREAEQLSLQLGLPGRLNAGAR